MERHHFSEYKYYCKNYSIYCLHHISFFPQVIAISTITAANVVSVKTILEKCILKYLPTAAVRHSVPFLFDSVIIKCARYCIYYLGIKRSIELMRCRFYRVRTRIYICLPMATEVADRIVRCEVPKFPVVVLRRTAVNFSNTRSLISPVYY